MSSFALPFFMLERGQTVFFVKFFAQMRKSSAFSDELRKNNLDKTRKFISFAVL
jgi:hypothetical protein